MYLYPIKILRSHMDSNWPIDTTRTLIRRGLVLTPLNSFKRVAVSLKLVSILLRSSSPPASLVFDVFFMRAKSQKTLKNGIRVVREIWFLLAEFSQPGCYVSMNPNIWWFVLTYRECFKFDSASLYCVHISFWCMFFVSLWIHPHVFLLVFHQLLPLTFFRGTNIFSWCCNTLQHTDSSKSRNSSLSVSLRKTPVCSLNKQSCRRLM